jgi:hypothetical protein
LYRIFTIPAQCTAVGAAHITVNPEIAAAGWRLTLLFPHLGCALALALALPLLQHAFEPHCIALGLATALDPLATLSLPHAIAQYGAIGTPAVVDGIGNFTW